MGRKYGPCNRLEEDRRRRWVHAELEIHVDVRIQLWNPGAWPGKSINNLCVLKADLDILAGLCLNVKMLLPALRCGNREREDGAGYLKGPTDFLSNTARPS
jgi:hypothetical protein